MQELETALSDITEKSTTNIYCISSFLYLLITPKNILYGSAHGYWLAVHSGNPDIEPVGLLQGKHPPATSL